MPNPVYSAMGGAPGPFGTFNQMMQKVSQFRRGFAQGTDPKQLTMQMVREGRLSQDQLNYVQQFVQQMMGGGNIG